MPDRIRRQGRIDAGLCAACGTVPPEPGACACAGCLETQRKAEASRRAALAREAICLDCRQRPALPQQRRCAACAARQRERMGRGAVRGNPQ